LSETISTDRKLSRIREYVAAALALIILATTVILILLSLKYTDNSESFSRANELLETLIPLLTFVLGYYFNKTSTEPRAEKAEETARAANDDARKANEAKARADSDAQMSKDETRDVKSALAELGQTTEKYLSRVSSPRPGTLGEEQNQTESEEKLRLELRAALLHAKRHIAWDA